MSSIAFGRPKHLELFCCEGGTAVGWHRAGFDVYGVDLFKHKDPETGKIVGYSQSRFPFASFQGNAISAMHVLLLGLALPFTHKDGSVEWLYLKDFASISASPPCQHASAGTRAVRQNGKEYPALIADTRSLLIQSGLPYVIENVRGADLIDPVELCGCMFGPNGMSAVDTDGITLYLQRPRRFESNFPISAPREHDHSAHEWVGGSYGGARRDKYDAKYVRKGGYVPSIPVQQELLGIDWMTQGGMFECVPPAYTEHLGAQLLAHIEGRAS